jgi:r-opsin
MVGLFVVSWLPYALIAQFGIIGLHDLVTPYSTEIPVLVAKASAIWNPIVYALTHPRYRVALREIIPCCRIFLRRKLSRERSRSKSDGGSQQSDRRQYASTTAGTPNVEMMPIDLSPTA